MHVVAARMGGGFWVNEAEGKPWVSRRAPDPRADRRRLKRCARRSRRFGLTGGKKRIAVDERTWAMFTMSVRALLPEAEFVSANEIIAPMRMIKSPEELDVMQRGSDLTDQVFRNILPKLKAGVTEYDIAHEIDYQFVTLGAEYTSFETGVFFIAEEMDGGGKTIRSGMRKLNHGDSIMFDFGGLIDGYASDFGRSAHLGAPSAEYQKVHDTVIKSQADAMARWSPGKCTAAEANRIARKVIADAGYDEGFTHRLGTRDRGNRSRTSVPRRNRRDRAPGEHGLHGRAEHRLPKPLRQSDRRYGRRHSGRRQTDEQDRTKTLHRRVEGTPDGNARRAAAAQRPGIDGRVGRRYPGAQLWTGLPLPDRDAGSDVLHDPEGTWGLDHQRHRQSGARSGDTSCILTSTSTSLPGFRTSA